MNTGDRVISKKIGPPVTGTIMAIYDAKFLNFNRFGVDFQLYKKEYPTFKRICGVALDQPIRPFSKDSFTGPNKDMEYLLQPAQTFMYYPEDDLEVFDKYVEDPKQKNEYEDYDSFPDQFET